MEIRQYIENLDARYQTGISGEHSYRGELQWLLESLTNEVQVINEPKRIECGAPDYILTKNDIPVGYIEAKDIGADLNSQAFKEQFERYRKSLDNLLITNYHDFQLFRNGELVKTLSIASLAENKILPHDDQFEEFSNLIQDFVTTYGQSIRSAEKLSTIMADKARLMKDVFQNTLNADLKDNYNANTALQEQYNAFKNLLIHDITPKDFADIYAQTIAYGMFAARLHDETLEDFSRQEAANLIPKSNPFLRKLFQFIAGYDLDERLKWIVDDLAEIFRATNVAELLRDFGKATATSDPIIHFYETFLAEYDPQVRKSRGVWYTPEPVVNFIVRAVDDILKTEFDLQDGLADTTKTKIKLDVPTHDNRYKSNKKKLEKEVHKVQILDPAAGTGTFLEEVIRNIYQRFEGQEGVWSQYVDEHLLPRVHGFEILMASYAMAHLKLDLLLKQTGYRTYNDQRFRIYLTNALEGYFSEVENMMAKWLAEEANEANRVKRDTPVMVVLGNPPYSVSSKNKGKWIQDLMKDYKEGLNEKKLNLDDDYIKFMRFGEYFIEKNGEGILAIISNNSFIDGITHKQIRKHLTETFNKIYILDLHGNRNKQETGDRGEKDENVFDIQQGVSINIFIKNGKKESTNLFHYDCLGSRKEKYEFLNNNNLNSIIWRNVVPDKENAFFNIHNQNLKNNYENYFSVIKLFKVYSSGIQTKRDSINICFTKNEAQKVLNDFKNSKPDLLIKKYKLPKDGRDWKLKYAKEDITKNKVIIHQEQYRPFDYRYSFFTGKSKGIIAYPREEVSKNLINKENYGLCIMRQFFQNTDFSHVLITNKMVDERTMYSNRGGTYVAPLYLYNTNENQNIFSLYLNRNPNINNNILNKISSDIQLKFTNEKEEAINTFAPIDLMDYIYAILHSPKYREKYKDFLKIDFPRIPYPKDQATFWQLVSLGGELRQIHLLESEKVKQFITTYPQDGDNVVRRKITKSSPGWVLIDEEKQLGRVWINDEQYFDQVPRVAWEFYIGGYQPVQKWLKDRKDRQLSLDDIMHYQKIIVALSETDRLMKEIDEIDFE